MTSLSFDVDHRKPVYARSELGSPAGGVQLLHTTSAMANRILMMRNRTASAFAIRWNCFETRESLSVRSVSPHMYRLRRKLIFDQVGGLG